MLPRIWQSLWSSNGIGRRNIGIGFVHGFGLARGSFAATVAHDAHNVVVAGVDDDDMVKAVQRLAEIGGGLVVALDGRIVGEMALPIAGLMSDKSAEEVDASLLGLEEGVGAPGCHHRHVVHVPRLPCAFGDPRVASNRSGHRRRFEVRARPVGCGLKVAAKKTRAAKCPSSRCWTPFGSWAWSTVAPLPSCPSRNPLQE